jgi:hypothetical protein
VADGSIYMSALALVIVLNVAVIFPGLLLLQPVRLWHLRRAEKEALTPRQTFRGKLADFRPYNEANSKYIASCIPPILQSYFCYRSMCPGYHFCVHIFTHFSSHRARCRCSTLPDPCR